MSVVRGAARLPPHQAAAPSTSRFPWREANSQWCTMPRTCPTRINFGWPTAHFARLPPEVACLQARLTIDNTHDSWLTRMFTIEYAALFDVFNPGLAAIGSPILLGGTSNHFRTRVLQGSADGTPGTSPRTPISASGSRGSVTGWRTSHPRRWRRRRASLLHGWANGHAG